MIGRRRSSCMHLAGHLRDAEPLLTDELEDPKPGRACDGRNDEGDVHVTSIVIETTPRSGIDMHRPVHLFRYPLKGLHRSMRHFAFHRAHRV